MASQNKRKLFDNEIEYILDFIKPNKFIPEDTANFLVNKAKNSFRQQLKKITIFPKLIEKLKKNIKKSYISSLIEPGESVGIITAQSIGEKQTQANLNTFHKAGSSDKQPVVSKFSELLNATNKPKAPSYFVYFNQGNSSVPELRKTIGNTIVSILMKKIVKEFTIQIDNEDEWWYDIYYNLYERKPDYMKDCISYKINTDILYEYKLQMKDIANSIMNEYQDSFCIFSPDNLGQLDVYFDTRNIELPEDKLVFVNKDNCKEIYLEEVVFPILENMNICGIPGIENMYFLKEDNGNWFIETDNNNEKIKKKNTKEKELDSVGRYKKILSHPKVDMSRTLSNNIWDIYHTLGIEAVREYMITEFSKIMEGINLCHVMLLVDKITFTGTICSISRYSMRNEESGPLGKASFEETLDNFLKAGVFGQEEPTKGVSASIICGKRAAIGTGICDLTMDIKKLLNK